MSKKHRSAIVHLFVLFMLIAIGYILNNTKFLVSDSINHIYPTIICLVFSFFYIFDHALPIIKKGKFKRNVTWYNICLSCVFYIVVFAILYTSPSILNFSGKLAYAVETHNQFSGASFGSISVSNNILYNFYTVVIFLFFIFHCYAYFWTNYIVAESSFVLFNKRVLYSGEKFFLSPLTDSNANVFKKRMRLYFQNMELSCMDASLRANIITYLDLSIEDARKDGVKTLDSHSFNKEIKNFIVNLIKKSSEKRKFKDVISYAVSPEQGKICGFPFSWDGCVYYHVMERKEIAQKNK